MDPSVFKTYLKNFNIKLKKNEPSDIKSLIDCIQVNSYDLEILNGFYVGYTIKQISKEFDLLRFSEHSVVNVEIKGESTQEKIIKQLERNKYYLGFLELEVFNFTYVVNEKRLYFFNEKEELVETNFQFLIEKLNEQNVIYHDLDKLFDPTNYLVSPFNSTEKFINGNYFLNENQEKIKKDILSLSTLDGSKFASIQGSAGTGKTLLVYDIAKEYLNSNKNVLIFHCGNLNIGHRNLNLEYSWTIVPMKNYWSYDVSKYELIIFDEVQRVNKSQLKILLDKIKELKVKCIFSFDPQQCMHDGEIQNDIPNYIIDEVSPEYYPLTEKIRTNKEIASFIKNFLDLSKQNPNESYSNINIQYFSTNDSTLKYLDILKEEDWEIINYSASLKHVESFDKYLFNRGESAHKVIGQEFDNVAVVIDNNFQYHHKKLIYIKDTYYHPVKMLLQILTRARKKLTLVIIGNETILKNCLEILNREKALK
ncbi:hypothetical protein CN514_00885 [Bacillus sp. AFS001701]|nr:hypothetical protein CN514_00885 [Bacillus sp. AFS001701]